jgi:hypothetical protein
MVSSWLEVPEEAIVTGFYEWNSVQERKGK